MRTSARSLSAPFNSNTAVVLLSAFLVVFSGCDGGDSSGPVHVFFGTNNLGECDSIGINLDLLSAGAEVGRLDDGTLDCAIDASLEVMGCVAIFDLLGDGDSLNVDIEGCRVPGTSSLFGCGFTKGDIAALDSVTSSFCDCVGEPACDWNYFCDDGPSICLSLDGNPSGCEDCFNQIDDDGDGYVDCGDLDCYISACGYGNSTVTCPNSTSTTVTTTTTID